MKNLPKKLASPRLLFRPQTSANLSPEESSMTLDIILTQSFLTVTKYLARTWPT